MKHVLLATVCLMAASPAYAQDVAQNQDPSVEDLGVPQLPSVLEEKAAEPDALARLIFGGSAGFTYSDNINKANSGEKSDLIAVIAPGIALHTDREDQKLSLRARIEHGRYMSHEENDYTDADLQGKARTLLTDTLWLLGNARLQYDHVDIGALVDEPGRTATEPTIYRTAAAGAGLESDDGVLYGLATTGYTLFNYDNVDSVGGLRIINDDRDRYEWLHRVRLGAYAAPGLLFYTEGRMNTRNYDARVDSNLIDPRDSLGYAGVLGAAFGTPKDETWFDVNAGYLAQNYDDSFLPDVGTYGFDAAGQWRLTPVLALKGRASRSVEENTLVGSSSQIMSRVRGGFEYQIDPLWTVGADLRYTFNDFQVNPVSGRLGREDTIMDASARVEYNIVGDYFGGLEYIRIDRNSTDSTLDYVTNAVLARLSLKY